MFNWIQEFNKGRQSIRDQECPGRPAEVSTEATVQRVEQIIRNEWHVSIDDIAHAVGCSHGTVYNIMHEQLKFLKVCALPVNWGTKKCSEWVCPCSPSIGTLRKERTSWQELLRETVLGLSLSTRIEKIFHGMETFHLANKKKVQDDSINLQGYAHHVLGHARGHTAEIPASRRECECCIVLHHYLPQVTWTPDKGSYSSG